MDKKLSLKLRGPNNAHWRPGRTVAEGARHVEIYASRTANCYVVHLNHLGDRQLYYKEQSTA
jgi:hypothetical protein